MKKLMLAAIILSLLLTGCVSNANPTTLDSGTTAEPGTSTQPITTTEATIPEPPVITVPSDLSDYTEYLELIFETDVTCYCPDEDFNHKNVINTETVRTKDESAPATRKVKINGVEKELQYKETIYYPLRNTIFHKYEKDGEEVLLRDDGSIARILYRFTTLDISESATPEEVLPKLKTVLAEYTDISQYGNVKMPTDTSGGYGGFGSYNFLFYKTAGGYMTDWITVSVWDDGSVSGFQIVERGQDITSLNIDKQLEAIMLTLKLKDVCTTQKTEFVSYEVSEEGYPSEVIARDGTLYIKYMCYATYLNKSTGAEAVSCLIEVLIPVDIITAE